MVGTQLLLSVYMAQVDYQLDRSSFDNQLDLPTVEYPTNAFFKISKFSGHRFRHSHSTLISYLGFIMTIVIVISSGHERKLYPMFVHLN